ncbi:hypothetical protein [Bacillus sp. 3255]|uniref:hypothetical protein n=1 Tax=Bacillus sp. 3255 TaxID=2817904 RepID=UPI0028554292|nr:hypothetical protein [Bacillus sp. 3255]MDR6884662.1 hypothetical protein [Bacillus sp. 3255]
MNVSISPTYFRLSGIAIVIGGLMGAAGQLIHAEDTPASVADIPSFVSFAVNTHVLLAWASTLLLLGLPAVYLRQAAMLRWWGWLGFPLLFIALMFEIFHGPVQILAYPIIFHDVTTSEQLQAVSDQINNLAIDQYPLQLAVLIPIVPFLFLGLILTAAGILQTRMLTKGPGIFLCVVIGITVLSQFIHIHLLEVSFSYIHLAFVYIGAALAFGRSEASSSAGHSHIA